MASRMLVLPCALAPTSRTTRCGISRSRRVKLRKLVRDKCFKYIRTYVVESVSAKQSPIKSESLCERGGCSVTLVSTPALPGAARRGQDGVHDGAHLLQAQVPWSLRARVTFARLNQRLLATTSLVQSHRAEGYCCIPPRE